MKRNTQAWMLRQDGQAFPVKVHLYVMDDPDLSSEAECAAFLVKTGSKDSSLAYHVLDCFMALGIENAVSYDATEDDICSAIENFLTSLPYHFSYPLSVSEMIAIHRSANNYSDIDSLYDFIDSINLADISMKMKDSINQQFCRVRFGGKYDYTGWGASTLWFRVSSLGYNWANTIYCFVADAYRGLGVNYISICRDYESDNGDAQGAPEYFYKAKDGTVYHEMPIDEYLAEEHEHSPVFSNRGVLSGVYACVRNMLACGHTFHEVEAELAKSDIELPYFTKQRMRRQEVFAACLEESSYVESLHIRTQTKLCQACEMIVKEFPEITNISDVSIESTENSKGNPVGTLLSLKLESDRIPKLNMWFDLKFNLPLGKETSGSIFRRFRKEYEDYLAFANIRI